MDAISNFKGRGQDRGGDNIRIKELKGEQEDKEGDHTDKGCV